MRGCAPHGAREHPLPGSWRQCNSDAKSMVVQRLSVGGEAVPEASRLVLNKVCDRALREGHLQDQIALRVSFAVRAEVVARAGQRQLPFSPLQCAGSKGAN